MRLSRITALVCLVVTIGGMSLALLWPSAPVGEQDSFLSGSKVGLPGGVHVASGRGVEQSLQRQDASSHVSHRIAELKDWPSLAGLPQFPALDEVALRDVEAGVFRALDAATRKMAHVADRGTDWERVVANYDAVKLTAEAACLQHGYYWVLEPGKALERLPELSRLFPRAWFVHMRPSLSNGQFVQVVFYIPHEVFPEIPDAIRRRVNFGKVK